MMGFDMKFFSAGIAFSLLAAPAYAADWTVQPGQSQLGFFGVQTGTPFKGSFGKWTAQISYDPANPQAAHVKIVIDTASAATGDTQRDTALPGSDWFDVSAFPQAVFEATGFVEKGGDHFEAPGTLTIRGVTRKITLPFTLDIAGKQATAAGHISLARTDYGVGQGAWTTGDYVALNVDVNFNFVATAN
jgi:polyisoprenoid-binding protein YceI